MSFVLCWYLLSLWQCGCKHCSSYNSFRASIAIDNSVIRFDVNILLLIVNKIRTSMAAIGKEYPKIINTSRTWRKGRQTFLQGFRQRESFYAGSYLFTLIRSQYSTKQNKAWHTSFGLNCISTGNENFLSSLFHLQKVCVIRTCSKKMPFFLSTVGRT